MVGWKEYLENIENMVDETLGKAVLELDRDIKMGAPVRTGRYRAGWITSKLEKLSYQISNNVEYAVYLIFGTRKMGIKHDVRGIVTYWKNHTLLSYLSKLLK